MSARPGFVMVTGGAKRVGAAICKRLAQDGWPLFIHTNTSAAEGRALADAINKAGGRAETGAFDLLDPDLAAKAKAARVGDLPWIGLVNSASAFEPDSAAAFDAALMAKMMQIHLAAPVTLIGALHAGLPAGARGFAINISDQKVLNPNPDYLSYTLSKIALHGANDVLTQAFAPRVRINTIAPGLMLPSGPQENFERVHAQTPLHEGTTPEDVADAAAFLANAPRITGAILSVDAGQRLIPSDRDVMFD
jgi:NAD(P)-dependent dehydrogenase (short-subunit alcohol dehydrogenase family)